jgi:hypothetical protein
MPGTDPIPTPSRAASRAPGTSPPRRRGCWRRSRRSAAMPAQPQPGIRRRGGEFDFLDYFSGPPLFAETLRRYPPAAEIEGYRLLRRED